MAILPLMIVAHVSTPVLRSALRLAARPDEDVVWSGPEADAALSRGFPRLVVREGEARWPVFAGTPEPGGGEAMPELVVTSAMLRRWERRRRRSTVPEPRVDVMAAGLELLIRDRARRGSWVDRSLGELSRATGSPLPAPFRGLARRVLERPAHYTGLSALATLTGVGTDALRARFQRRGLHTPTWWLRRLRSVAAGHLLSDGAVTTLAASHRLGIGDAGNLCRLLREAGGTTPTALRKPTGRTRLLLGLAAALGPSEVRAGWESLDPLFLRGAA